MGKHKKNKNNITLKEAKIIINKYKTEENYIAKNIKEFLDKDNNIVNNSIQFNYQHIIIIA